MKRIVVILIALIVAINVNAQENSQSEDLNARIDSLTTKLNQLQHDFDFLDCRYKIDNLKNDTVILKFNLSLGGMYINIHSIRINLEIKHIGRRNSFWDKVFISLHNGLVQVWALEKPSVYEEILIPQPLPCRIGTPDEPVQFQHRRICVNIHQFVDKGSSQYVLDPEFQ